MLRAHVEEKVRRLGVVKGGVWLKRGVRGRFLSTLGVKNEKRRIFCLHSGACFVNLISDETKCLLLLLYWESRARCSGHPLIARSKDDFKNSRAPKKEWRFFYKRKRE
jgi:hypothetical protein